MVPLLLLTSLHCVGDMQVTCVPSIQWECLSASFPAVLVTQAGGFRARTTFSSGRNPVKLSRSGHHMGCRAPRTVAAGAEGQIAHVSPDLQSARLAASAVRSYL